MKSAISASRCERGFSLQRSSAGRIVKHGFPVELRPVQPRQIFAAVRRYLAAVVFVITAAGIARIINPRIGESTAALFFAAVILSAWAGGLGPGLLATALAAFIAGRFYHLNPVGTPGFGWDDWLQAGVFVSVAVLISWLTSMRRRAEAALKKSYDELEIRIRERTAELSQSNSLLRESEERFRLMVEGVPDYAIVMLDANGSIVSWNPGATRIFGYTHEEAIGRSASAFYPPEDTTRGQPAADLLDAAQLGRCESEGWRIRQDSTRFWANVITSAVRDESGKLRSFAQITRDVSELRSLEKEVLEISEREQMRIGHDLHDGVGQELTGVALLTQNLRQRLAQQGLAEESQAARIALLINRALEQTRKLARGFSPVELGPQGLETALRDLAMKVQSAMQRGCSVACRDPVEVVDDATALHLFRIAQEAVNNAVRHSTGRQIRIELDTIEGTTNLAIHDDGAGLPPPKSRGKGMGISVMQYRARMIGGSLEIKSSSTGTSVICRCPSPSKHDSPANNRQKAASVLSQTATARAAGR
jgi:two-component system sensor kinase FixL